MPCPSRLSLMLHRRTDPQHFCSLNRLTFSKFVLRLAVVVFWTPQNILGTLFFLVAPVLEGTTKCNFLMFLPFSNTFALRHSIWRMDLRHFVSLSTTSSLVDCRNKTQIKFVILSPVDRFMWGLIQILHISICYVTLLVIIDASCFSQLWWQTWNRAVLKYLCNTVFVCTTFCAIHLLAVFKLVQPSLLAKRLRRMVCAFLRFSIFISVCCGLTTNCIIKM
jgi:hypothetical protein